MYYRQPAYFKDFKCIGGDCPITCCTGWRIDWKTEEIEKIKNNPNCSEELLALMESSFKKCDDVEYVDYTINTKADGHCPMQCQDGLCRIQKELGADHLSHTCMSYPRTRQVMFNSTTKSFTEVYRHCEMSCPAVAERIISDKNAMTLVNQKVTETTASVFQSRDPEKHPEQLYKRDIFELFYELISDKKFSIETAVIHGAIAAQILQEIIDEKQYEQIPQAIKEIRAGFMKGNMFKALDDIKPDYKIKVAYVAGIARKINILSALSSLKTPEGKLDLALYFKGEKKLSQMFSNDDYWLRNIALNLLFEIKFPYYMDYSLMETYSLFIFLLSVFKLNAIAVLSVDTDSFNLTVADKFNADFTGIGKVWGFTALISRGLCQTTENEQFIIKSLKEANFTTPMQLALLIK